MPNIYALSLKNKQVQLGNALVSFDASGVCLGVVRHGLHGPSLSEPDPINDTQVESARKSPHIYTIAEPAAPEATPEVTPEVVANDARAASAQEPAINPGIKSFLEDTLGAGKLTFVPRPASPPGPNGNRIQKKPR